MARVLQLLRSSDIYASFDAAKTAITGLTGKKDGEIVLGRYTSGSNTYSAIGVYHNVNNQSGWTVYKSTDDIETAITALQTELDNTQTGAGLGANGAYTAPVTGEAGFDILGGNNAPTNLKAAIAKIADVVAGMDHNNNYTAGATPSVTDASKVIAGINQTDGKIDTVTTDAVDLLLTGYANDGTTNTGTISASDTVETALNKLENATTSGVQVSAKTGNQITRVTGEETAANNGLYSHVELVTITGTELTDLGTNVKEAYKLQSNGADIAGSAPIKIYKDSALKEVYLGSDQDTVDATTGTVTKQTVTDAQSLNFVYQLADGTYSIVKIDVSKFLTESEFGDGLDVSSTGVVSVKAGNGLVINATGKEVDVNPGNGIEIASDAVAVKIDTASEKDTQATPADFLTVGADGVKVQGIKDEIDRKIAAQGIDAEGDTYINAGVVSGNNKKIQVTANVADLTATAGTAGVYNATTGAETTAPTNGSLSGSGSSLADAADIATKVKTYVDGQIAIEAARSDAKNKADIYALNGTADADGANTTATTPNADFKVLTKVVETAGAIVPASTEAVNLKKVAATGAAADVSYSNATSSMTATNVQTAIDELDTRIDALGTDALEQVTSANAGIVVGTKANHSQELTLTLDTTTVGTGAEKTNADNALTITDAGLFLSNTIDCGTF